MYFKLMSLGRSSHLCRQPQFFEHYADALAAAAGRFIAFTKQEGAFPLFPSPPEVGEQQSCCIFLAVPLFHRVPHPVR
jgi:hypothetical protein